PCPGALPHRVRHRAALEEADALEEVTRGDAGGGEHHVALGQIVQGEDPVEVLDPHGPGTLRLLLVAGLEPALEVAADTADGGRGEHALRRSADAHQHVHSRLLEAGGHRAGHVAVSDQLDPAAAAPHPLVDLRVPGPAGDTDGEVLNVETGRASCGAGVW